MNKLLFSLVFVVLLLLNISAVFAHCPLCTAAVGTGVAVTRFYGIDDAVVGLWIGAFVVSTAMWFSRLLKKEYLPFQDLLFVVLALVLTVVPFYFAGLMTNMYAIFGIDRLLFGIVTGSIITYLGVFVSEAIKRGKNVLFPFQTIVIIMSLLVLASAILVLIGR